jgi:hypothetical protein
VQGPAIKTIALAVTAGLFVTGCATPRIVPLRTQLRRFDHFEGFERTISGSKVVILSPRLEVLPWNELLVSWNASCPPGTTLTVAARAFESERATRFYTIGHWSAEPGTNRVSVRHERDADAAVDTETLICRRLMNAAQVRLTLRGTNGTSPQLKLLSFSSLNSSISPTTNAPNHTAWGRVLEVPERSQLGYKGGSGWCSPTSLSMLLGYWSGQLHRADLDVPVPETARQVNDVVYGGTGNWAFNMAYAGSFDGMRAWAARFDDFRQVEDWIAAGIPVALSVSFDLLNGKAVDQNNGHLIVVVGFTETGDVVVNDPWPNPKKENRVRKIFPREQVIRAWQRSKQTVYLVVPEHVRPPRTL